VSLWDWSLGAYARPGVEALCLELQDEHGQCVPYLLWAAWAAAEGRAPDPAILAQAASVAREWESAVVGPLRSVRRALAEPKPGLAPAGQRSLRIRVKAEELASERLLLEALEPIAPPRRETPLDLQEALTAAAAAWGSAPVNLIEALARAFSAG
jgi:uncharacterized protein (TIGR02444 family)